MTKRIMLALVVVLIAGAAFAVENSVTFMPLVSSQRFLDRVTYNIDQEAAVIQAESTAIGCHGMRAQLAIHVSQNPQAYAVVFATALAGHINVTTAGALTGAGATLDTPATDAALFAAIASVSVWNSIAGCST